VVTQHKLSQHKHTQLYTLLKWARISVFHSINFYVSVTLFVCLFVCWFVRFVCLVQALNLAKTLIYDTKILSRNDEHELCAIYGNEMILVASHSLTRALASS